MQTLPSLYNFIQNLDMVDKVMKYFLQVIGTKLSVDYRLHDERSDWRAAAACYILSRHIQEGSSERKWVITEGKHEYKHVFKAM